MVTHLLTPVLVSARRSASPFRPARTTRAGSEPYVPPPSYWNREGSVPRGGPSVFDRATSLAPFTRPSFRASSLEPLDELFERKLPAIAEADSAPADAPSRPLGIFERAGSPSPTPVKAGRWGPRPTEVAYDAEGKNPNFTYTFPTKKKKKFEEETKFACFVKNLCDFMSASFASRNARQNNDGVYDGDDVRRTRWKIVAIFFATCSDHFRPFRPSGGHI